MSDGPKLIYLTKRHPALDRGGFIHWWRQHWVLANANDRWRNVRRYVQCEVLEDPTRRIGGAAEQDGVAIVTFHSEAARLAHRDDGGAQKKMEDDEARLFADLIRNHALVAQETVLREGPRAGVKLFRFLQRRPELPSAQFQREWIEGSGQEQLDAMRRARRIVHNQAIAANRTGGWGLKRDVVEEFWYEGPDELVADVAQERINPALSALRERLLADRLDVVTDEVLLTEIREGEPWMHDR